MCDALLVLLTLSAADGHADPPLLEKLAKIGEIKVELSRCLYKGVMTADVNHNHSFKSVGEDNIPEKAMKGRSVSSHAK